MPRSFQLRVRFQTLRAVADEVVDGGLVRFQVGHVLLERARAARCRGRKSGQRQQLVAPLVILVQPLLDDAAERLPDLAEALGVVAGQVFQLGDDAAGDGLADLGHLRIVLQHLARDVER